MMNEPVEKSSEQSVVGRALVLRTKMASDDLYKKYIYCAEEYESSLITQTADSTVWDDWIDWPNGPK